MPRLIGHRRIMPELGKLLCQFKDFLAEGALCWQEFLVKAVLNSVIAPGMKMIDEGFPALPRRQLAGNALACPPIPYSSRLSHKAI